MGLFVHTLGGLGDCAEDFSLYTFGGPSRFPSYLFLLCVRVMCIVTLVYHGTYLEVRGVNAVFLHRVLGESDLGCQACTGNTLTCLPSW